MINQTRGIVGYLWKLMRLWTMTQAESYHLVPVVQLPDLVHPAGLSAACFVELLDACFFLSYHRSILFISGLLAACEVEISEMN